MLNQKEKRELKRDITNLIHTTFGVPEWSNEGLTKDGVGFKNEDGDIFIISVTVKDPVKYSLEEALWEKREADAKALEKEREKAEKTAKKG